MASSSIPQSSVEDIWVPVRSEHPVSGGQDLSTTTVAIAIVVRSTAPAAGDWVSATWEPSTKIIGRDSYYLAKVAVGSGSLDLPAGNYDVYARITSGSRAAVVLAGPLTVF